MRRSYQKFVARRWNALMTGKEISSKAKLHHQSSTRVRSNTFNSLRQMPSSTDRKIHRWKGFRDTSTRGKWQQPTDWLATVDTSANIYSTFWYSKPHIFFVLTFIIRRMRGGTIHFKRWFWHRNIPCGRAQCREAPLGSVRPFLLRMKVFRDMVRGWQHGTKMKGLSYDYFEGSDHRRMVLGRTRS